MGSDRSSVPVSLPPELVTKLDSLVEEGVFSSRSEALRYGARLVVREDRLTRLHDRTDAGPERTSTNVWTASSNATSGF